MALVLTAFRRIAHAGLRDYARRMVVNCGAPRRTGHRSFVTGTQPLRDGEKITVEGSPGDSLLDVVINEDLDFDGFGACEGTLACSTCHLIFDEDVYKKLGPVTDEEMDMLDLAYGLTDTSRLGCQICLSRSLEGMVARVPESVADIRQSKDGSS
ncbi:adrenodoxin isoform X2 [Dunckerocampus dactyliophorus]|uniref:adrenodoxin isoform X2 n=1 Tax=Dunckerocampus dactyliophorus TaxID=161453 RepID=UPI0024069638|nr:adrenodoxin isoform X2 [Dunckerocampus dactyliophorus]